MNLYQMAYFVQTHIWNLQLEYRYIADNPNNSGKYVFIRWKDFFMYLFYLLIMPIWVVVYHCESCEYSMPHIYLYCIIVYYCIIILYPLWLSIITYIYNKKSLSEKISILFHFIQTSIVSSHVKDILTLHECNRCLWRQDCFSTALYHCWLLRVTSYFYFLLLYPCMFEILICLFL